jgi:hypothetical protein
VNGSIGAVDVGFTVFAIAKWSLVPSDLEFDVT